MFSNSSVFIKDTKKSGVNNQSGFGLVELMVSISIMVIVSAIILARQDSFNSAVLLRSQAYEIALALREVQLSAVSASGDTGSFRTVYGVHFTSETSPAADPLNGYFQVFKDANNDGFLSTGEEFGPRGNLDKRFEVRAIRIGGAPSSELAVVFVRPNFDALFFDDAVGGAVSASTIEIDIARRGISGTGPDVVRTIEVTSTGQIAVKS